MTLKKATAIMASQVFQTVPRTTPTSRHGNILLVNKKEIYRFKIMVEALAIVPNALQGLADDKWIGWLLTLCPVTKRFFD
jgi:hypothetical protein